MSRCLSFSFAAVLVFGLPSGSLDAQNAPPAATQNGKRAVSASPVPPSSPNYRKFEDAMQAAHAYLSQRNVTAAVDEYAKADRLANGACDVCYTNIYKLSMETHDFKHAVEAAAGRVSSATDLKLRSKFEVEQAEALYAAQGDKPKPAKLVPVSELLQSAIRDNAKNVNALYLEGRIQAQMGQLDAAKTTFAQCVLCDSPNDPMLGRIRRFAEQPELSYQRRAPAFAVTALDGSRFTLDDMGGRVVLIDFWATWCGPCREELPEMKRIAKEFAGQPLVILSVSWDSDVSKWKDFISKNGMDWAQFRDADHKLTESFGVDAIPHYFTIDSDGVLTSEMLGSGSDVEGKLKKLIARAKLEQTAKAASGVALPAAATQ